MRYRLLLLTAAFVFAADALTKIAAVALSHRMPIRLPDGWALQVAHNYGVSFGVGARTAAPAVFALTAAAEIAFLLIVSRHQSGSLLAVALGLILGSAIGNLGEHQVFGCTVDWIKAPTHPTLTFDLADVAVVTGQVLLIALLALGRRAGAQLPVSGGRR